MANISKRVSAGSRVYYFDVRTDRKGNDYVTISEISKATGIRQSVYLHKEDFGKFAAALSECIAAVSGWAK